MDKTKGQGEMKHMPKEMLESKLQFPLFQVSSALIPARLWSHTQNIGFKLRITKKSLS